MEGMHTQLPEDVLGSATVVRCQNIWWSLYIMDRHFSPSLGLPMTTQDSDISTLISPQISEPRDVTFSLQVRITRMLSFIISGKSLLNYHTFSFSNAFKLKPSIKRRKLNLEHF